MTGVKSEVMQPSTAEIEGSGRQDSRFARSLRLDAVIGVGLVVLVLLFLFKTSFAGGSISRLCVLAEWDSVFDKWRTGHPQPYDPSLVQIFLPDYVYLARQLSHWVLPLWNQHCGLGYPFVGDIQTSLFAPLRAVLDFVPTLAAYNYFLILELIVCAVSTYFLALSLLKNLSEDGFTLRIASVFAAVCYTFCPYNLWYLELNLGSSASLFPLIALAFVNAAEKRTVGAAVLAGVASGALILSGHPECSFFGILLSAALMFLLLLLSPDGSTAARLFTSLNGLVIAALVTVAISAPQLFPFAEYLLNGESYKYGSAYSTPVTWNGILFNLCNPGNLGASPYLGIIAALLLPLWLFNLKGFYHSKFKLLALLILTATTFLLVSQLGPIQQLFMKPPFTAIITRYALPYLLLLLSLVASSSILLWERDLPDRIDLKELAVRTIAVTVSAAAFLSFSSHFAHDATWLKMADFDAMLPPTAFNDSAWRRDIACAAVFAVLNLLLPLIGQRFPRFKPQHTIPAAALLLSFISMCSVSKLSLPQQSKFFYPKTELLSRLKDDQYRSLSTCEYVLRPATNAVYGINFLTVHNPLFPKRFLEFIKACGAETDVFNQKFGSKLSPLLNIASVKHVLSIDPVSDAAGSPDRFSQVYQCNSGIKIYDNKDAAPRAYIVHNWLTVASPTESLTKIQSLDFDPRLSVVIESKEARQPVGGTRDHGDVNLFLPSAMGSERGLQNVARAYEQVSSFDDSNPNCVAINTESKDPGWLVLTDIYYPGWNAYIDGQQTPIEHANYAFRAIKLPAGKHAVRFSYEPASFACGCAAFAAFILLLICSVKLNFLKREI